uniref:Uncharacterized protein n=1 Tax=Anguilla anguilla TaxID=7936 RepID=A0A0E9TI14_ANGAN
MYRVSPQKSC